MKQNASECIVLNEGREIHANTKKYIYVKCARPKCHKQTTIAVVIVALGTNLGPCACDIALHTYTHTHRRDKSKP